MAHILAPSAQWQARMVVPDGCSIRGKSVTANIWKTLLTSQRVKGAKPSRRATKLRGLTVVAKASDNSTVNRLENLLNLDVTPYTDKIIAEYIWIGGSGIDLRSKARTISRPVEHPSELPKWNYDGSSTGQAPGEDSEQEYTLLQPNVKWPLGWPAGGYPGPQGPYYCGTGADKAFGRDISDAHYKACLYSGINISGTNGEVMPGQRITEMAGVVLSLDPKPIEGDWNGAGCHTNYSTKSMREEGGFEVIKKAILNLSLRHKEHISAYGEGNERRLTGKHETASIDTFSWGVANRGCSIRVGRETEKQGKGYLEDRRPASNMDPYVVTSLLAETTILWEPTLEAEALAAKKLQLQV
ncbi:Glutamine synthetase leaf isozyme [Nymphaea thermarum]|nr:Glutamine synthetase leaf isozyme [Nymphaea thermarum]